MQIPSFRPDEISTTKFFISFLAKKIEVSHGVSDDIDKLSRKMGYCHFDINAPRRLIVRFRDRRSVTRMREDFEEWRRAGFENNPRGRFRRNLGDLDARPRDLFRNISPE